MSLSLEVGAIFGGWIHFSWIRTSQSGQEEKDLLHDVDHAHFTEQDLVQQTLE